AVMLVSIICRHCSRLARWAGAVPSARPALLTSTSMPRNGAGIASSAACIASASRMSNTATCRRSPPGSSRSACRRPARRPVATTRQPSARKRRTAAAPNPAVAPVMRMVRAMDGLRRGGDDKCIAGAHPHPGPPPQAGEGGRFCKPIPACGGSVGRWTRRDRTCKPPPPLAGEGRGGGTPAINARPATAASAPRLPVPCLLAGRLRQLLLPRPAPPGCRLAAGGGPGRGARARVGGGWGGWVPTPAINARPATAASAPRLPVPCLLAGRLRQLLLPRPAPPGCRLAAGGGPGRAMLLQHALGQHHILGQEPGGLGDGDPRLGAVLVGVGLQQFADRFAQRALGAALELEVAAFAEQRQQAVAAGLDQGGFAGEGGSPPVPPVSRPGIARTATRDDAAVPADALVPRACHAPVAPAATDQ